MWRISAIPDAAFQTAGYCSASCKGTEECGPVTSSVVKFAVDSLLEEDGFEPSVPLYILTVSEPLLVGPVTVPFAKRKSSVGDRVPNVRRLLLPPSIPGHRLGALRWRVTGGRDLHPSAYTPLAR